MKRYRPIHGSSILQETARIKFDYVSTLQLRSEFIQLFQVVLRGKPSVRRSVRLALNWYRHWIAVRPEQRAVEAFFAARHLRPLRRRPRCPRGARPQRGRRAPASHRGCSSRTAGVISRPGQTCIMHASDQSHRREPQCRLQRPPAHRAGSGRSRRVAEGLG